MNKALKIVHTTLTFSVHIFIQKFEMKEGYIVKQAKHLKMMQESWN